MPTATTGRVRSPARSYPVTARVVDRVLSSGHVSLLPLVRAFQVVTTAACFAALVFAYRLTMSLSRLWRGGRILS